MDRLKLGKKLGEGAMGKVFLSTYIIDKDTKKTISAAVKQIPANLMNMDEIILQAQLSRLPNCEEHIACFYDIMRNPKNNTYQIVMEYIEGKEMWDYVSEHKGPFTDKELLDIMEQALAGLNFIHDHEIAHGDIKLENFMMDKHHKLKFIDFGYGCNNKTCPTSPRWHGTTYLSPPEAFKRQKEKNLIAMQRADLWALGSMFAELTIANVNDNSLMRTDEVGMSGSKVHRKSDKKWRASAQLSAVNQKRDDLTPKIYKVIDGLMRINPDNRLSASDALALLQK